MITDPSHEYLLKQVIRRNAQDMMSGFIPYHFHADPLNRHYDDRRAWLAWREPDQPTLSTRSRLGQALVRLGQWLDRREAAQPVRT